MQPLGIDGNEFVIKPIQHTWLRHHMTDYLRQNEDEEGEGEGRIGRDIQG